MVWNYLFLFSESLPNEPIKKLNFFFLVNNCVHATGSAFLLTIPSSWGSSAATGAVSSSTLTSASTDAPSAKSADIAPSVTWLHAHVFGNFIINYCVTRNVYVSYHDLSCLGCLKADWKDHKEECSPKPWLQVRISALSQVVLRSRAIFPWLRVKNIGSGSTHKISAPTGSGSKKQNLIQWYKTFEQSKF